MASKGNNKERKSVATFVGGGPKSDEEIPMRVTAGEEASTSKLSTNIVDNVNLSAILDIKINLKPEYEYLAPLIGNLTMTFNNGQSATCVLNIPPPCVAPPAPSVAPPAPSDGQPTEPSSDHEHFWNKYVCGFRFWKIALFFFGLAICAFIICIIAKFSFKKSFWISFTIFFAPLLALVLIDEFCKIVIY